jgi:ferrous iron transport protein B
MSYKHHKEQLDRSDNRNQNDHHDHHFRRKRHRKKEHHHSYETNSKTDELLTHPVWGLIIFVGIIWFIFFCTFKMGSYPQAGIEWLMDKAAFNIRELLLVSWINDFLTKGVIMGVGSVLAFLPNILILFFFLSLLSETQYLPRAAVIMDKYMHRIGLHGSSFIPLLMGFGCNVPAIMATRTIERKSDRIITMLMIPYIPCSARIPTFLLFSGIFFPQHQVTVLMSLYFGGILIGILMALLFKKIFFHFSKKDYHIPLPPYQTPSWYKTLLNMWGGEYDNLFPLF